MDQKRKPRWPVWAAFGWLVFLFLFLPSISFSRHNPPPVGSYLWFKIATTFISTIACILLLWIPRGWWKVAAILVAGILVFVQLTAWANLP